MALVLPIHTLRKLGGVCKDRSLGITWVAAIAAFILACTPSPKLPLTGEASLKFVRVSDARIYFRMANQTSQVVSFRGTYSRSQGGDPWDVSMECKERESDEWTEGPISLIDGQPEKVEVPPGEQMDLVASQSQHEFIQEFKGGRCRLNLKLLDGRSIESDEFEP